MNKVGWGLTVARILGRPWKIFCVEIMLIVVTLYMSVSGIEYSRKHILIICDSLSTDSSTCSSWLIPSSLSGVMVLTLESLA